MDSGGIVGPSGIREIQYPPLPIVDVVMEDVGGHDEGGNLHVNEVITLSSDSKLEVGVGDVVVDVEGVHGVGVEAGDDEVDVFLGGGVTLVGRNFRFEKVITKSQATATGIYGVLSETRMEVSGDTPPSVKKLQMQSTVEG
ncbi:aminodeoxychorismate synthase, component I [Sesbania bispinosa]|nr:aminodeoxychorismate synthase, component I [Sesbania bispinosa]